MSRLQSCFAALAAQGRKALVPYITAGDPAPEYTVPIMHELVRSGADIIEVGVPFSDPMADGPVIQAACERALRHGVTLHGVLDMIRTFRKDNVNTPVVVMGYQNPMEVMGVQKFTEQAHEAGVDGVLTVDLPPEEAVDSLPWFQKYQLSPIFLVAPTTEERRMQTIADHASGFLYYVSFKGVTGANRLDVSAVQSKIQQIRTHTTLPIAVGFGVKDAQTARDVAQVADAVVVGSAIVARIAETSLDISGVCGIVRDTVTPIRAALDSISNKQSVA